MSHVKAHVFRDGLDINHVVEEMVEEGNGLVGCVLAFIGVVRSIADDGVKVEKLSYEAYEEVIEKEMHRISKEIALKHNVIGVRAYHKVEDAYAKQPAMYLFISSRHRKEAFSALIELVEKMKHEIPIWKKEHTDRGSRWVKS